MPVMLDIKERAQAVEPVPPRLSGEERAQRIRDEAIDVALKPYLEEQQEEREFFKALADREFYTRDLASNVGTATSNLGAQIAGFPSDVVGLMAMAYATDPRNRAILASKGYNVENITDLPAQVPGNSEQIAELIGGDPNHPSFLPTGLVAPGPGELVGPAKAMFGGAIGASRAGIGRLDEFLKRDTDIFDFQAWKDTGWFKWFDGKPRFHISDAGTVIEPAVVMNKMKNLKLDVGQSQSIRFTMGELMDHPELYKAYPELKDTPVHLHFTRTEEGTRILNLAAEEQGITGIMRNGEITVFKAENLDELKTTLIHEAQHKIQKIEDFAGGSNSAKYNDLLSQTKSVLAEKAVADDILHGMVDKRDIDGALAYSDDIAAEFGISQDKAREMVYSYLNVENLEQEAQLLGALESRALGEVGLFLEQVGGKGDIEQFVKDMPYDAMQRLAKGRYLREGGEVEARMQEYLRNLTTEEIQASRQAPAGLVEGVGVKPEQVVVDGSRAPNTVANEVVDFPTKAPEETFINWHYLDNIRKDAANRARILAKINEPGIQDGYKEMLMQKMKDHDEIRLWEKLARRNGLSDELISEAKRGNLPPRPIPKTEEDIMKLLETPPDNVEQFKPRDID